MGNITRSDLIEALDGLIGYVSERVPEEQWIAYLNAKAVIQKARDKDSMLTKLAKQRAARANKKAKQLFQCEEEGCTETAVGELPKGWCQTGESRFPDALQGLASWCVVHWPIPE